MSPKTLWKCILNSLYNIVFYPFSKESRKQREAVSGSPRCPTALIISMPCLAPPPSTATEWGVTRRGPSPCGENHVCFYMSNKRFSNMAHAPPEKKGHGEMERQQIKWIYIPKIVFLKWNFIVDSFLDRVFLLSCSRGMVTREIGTKLSIIDCWILPIGFQTL